MSPGVLLQARISVSYVGQGLGNLLAHQLSFFYPQHACLTHACGDLSAAGVEIKD